MHCKGPWCIQIFLLCFANLGPGAGVELVQVIKEEDKNRRRGFFSYITYLYKVNTLHVFHNTDLGA